MGIHVKQRNKKSTAVSGIMTGVERLLTLLTLVERGKRRAVPPRLLPHRAVAHRAVGHKLLGQTLTRKAMRRERPQRS
jgi:hypothetical protein